MFRAKKLAAGRGTWGRCVGGWSRRAWCQLRGLGLYLHAWGFIEAFEQGGEVCRAGTGDAPSTPTLEDHVPRLRAEAPRSPPATRLEGSDMAVHWSISSLR